MTKWWTQVRSTGVEIVIRLISEDHDGITNERAVEMKWLRLEKPSVERKRNGRNQLTWPEMIGKSQMNSTAPNRVDARTTDDKGKRKSTSRNTLHMHTKFGKKGK
jgi:hypothetical protein